MLSKKTIKWINENSSNMVGKTVVVTGANSGIGFKTVETLVYLGAKVIMACRNMEKANKARDLLINDYPNACISIMSLDLASFSSIDNFILNLKGIDIDVFVNNAGVFHMPNMKTKDGFELVIGTNYYGVYYLSEKLLPYLKCLKHTVHYINTISMIHKIGKINYDDFYHTKKYNNFSVYATSKVCLARYTYFKALEYKDSNVLIYMNHPGVTITPLAVNSFNISEKIIYAFKWMFNSLEKSSLSVIKIINNNYDVGSIVGPNILLGVFGYPKVNYIYKKVKNGGLELIDFTEKEIGGVNNVLV